MNTRFYVYDFNRDMLEFDAVAGFDIEIDAHCYAEEHRSRNAGGKLTVVGQDWKAFVDNAVSARLGVLARAIATQSAEMIALFERVSERLGGNKPMPTTFSQRVSEEYRELDSKLQKLRVFLVSDKFLELADGERDRLRQQDVAMSQYARILADRLDANFQ